MNVSSLDSRAARHALRAIISGFGSKSLLFLVGGAEALLQESEATLTTKYYGTPTSINLLIRGREIGSIDR